MKKALLLLLSCLSVTLQAQLSGLIGQYSFNFPFSQAYAMNDETPNNNEILAIGELMPEEDRNMMVNYSVGLGTLTPIITNSHMVINEDQNSPVYENLLSYSISFWFMAVGNNSTDPESGVSTIFNMKGSGSPYFNLYIDYDDGNKIKFINGNNSMIMVDLESNDGMERNEWMHIAVTVGWDGKCELFINGLSHDQATGTLLIPDDTKLIFGMDHNSNGLQEWICMDDLHIFNRALSTAEVGELENLNLLSHNINPSLQRTIQLYPNPVFGSFVELSLPSDLLDFEIEVMSANGKVIGSQKNNARIPVAHLASGTYLIRVITEEGIAVKKMSRIAK